MQPVNFYKILKASFLISGTCIGGGMLALPISSNAFGLIPTLIIMLVCCVFMTLTGLLYLEATLWMKEQTAHINTLSATLLNRFWRAICWVTFIFICYASLIAYISGGGKEIAFVVTEIFQGKFTIAAGMTLFVLLFGLVLFLGHRSISRVNTILFISMIFSYILLIGLSSSKIEQHLLERQQWGTDLLFVIPIVLAMFSFPGLVPSIVPYLQGNKRAVRKAIIYGTSLTFLVYFLWILLVFGSVPHKGEHGLQEAFKCDIPATECLHYALKNPLISSIAQFFAFFALATSFLGISLALLDFLTDTIHVKLEKKVLAILFCLLILAPSLLFAIYYDKAFITALELTGGIGDALLSGIIPALMVWNGRYFYKYIGEYRVWGGKAMLFAIILFASLVLFCEIARRVFL